MELEQMIGIVNGHSRAELMEKLDLPAMGILYQRFTGFYPDPRKATKEALADQLKGLARSFIERKAPQKDLAEEVIELVELATPEPRFTDEKPIEVPSEDSELIREMNKAIRLMEDLPKTIREQEDMRKAYTALLISKYYLEVVFVRIKVFDQMSQQQERLVP